MSKKSRTKWTTTCWAIDPQTNKLAPYIRLLPDFMDTSELNRPWGLSIGGFRPDEQDATNFAKDVDDFMESLVTQHARRNRTRPHTFRARK